jgi:L-threonylcarbamoyladenylate synthase
MCITAAISVTAPSPANAQIHNFRPTPKWSLRRIRNCGKNPVKIPDNIVNNIVNIIGKIALSDFKLHLAAHHIRRGGIVAYPTEAVYGLGCDPFNGEAVLRLLALKQRPVAKGLIVIAADFAQIEPFILPLSPAQLHKLHQSWPGPTTWLIPAKPNLPRWIVGDHNRIALRITAHPIAKALCEAADQAIISTSANVSQRPPAKSPLGVRRYFNDRLTYILTGPVGGLNKPTPITDLVTGQAVRR